MEHDSRSVYSGRRVAAWNDSLRFHRQTTRGLQNSYCYAEPKVAAG